MRARLVLPLVALFVFAPPNAADSPPRAHPGAEPGARLLAFGSGEGLSTKAQPAARPQIRKLAPKRGELPPAVVTSPLPAPSAARRADASTRAEVGRALSPARRPPARAPPALLPA